LRGAAPAVAALTVAAIGIRRVRRIVGRGLIRHPVVPVVLGMRGGVRRGRSSACCRYRSAIQHQGQRE